MRREGLLTFAALLLIQATSAPAQSFEKYCDLRGFTSPLRQTIVVIDEFHVYPEPAGREDPKNTGWRRFVGGLLLPDPATLERGFMPRERVTIMLARMDAGGLKPIFTGCLPLFSAEERRAIAADAGTMQKVNDFFGTGALSDAKKSMDLFRIRLGESFRGALEPSALSAPSARTVGDLAGGGFVTSLKQRNFANMAFGIPRVIIYSDMTRMLAGFPADRVKARQLASSKAREADLDLGSAELYLVGMAGNPIARDALERYFLEAHAELIAMAKDSVSPSFLPAPSEVHMFQGLIQYPDNQFPVRIRLATDRNGTVLNSWISVHTSKEQFAPFHGVFTCGAGSACRYNGDELFSQVWNPNRGMGAEPVFDANLPFAGARPLAFDVQDQKLKGAISDSLLRFTGVKGAKLEFSATKQPNARF